MRHILVTILILTAGDSSGAPAAEPDPGVQEVVECARRNFPHEAIIQTVEFRTRDRAGGERTLAGKLYWKRSPEGRARVLLRVEEPSELRDSAYLILEKEKRQDMFVYLPSLEKVRRITPRAMAGSLFGTDFSYEDFRRIQTITEEEQARRLPDAALGGIPVYLLEVTPSPDEGSGYARVAMFVDRERCVPLKIEFYEREDSLRKVLTANTEAIQQAGDVWLPREILIRDLKRQTQTRLRVEGVEVDADLPDQVFSQSSLLRRR